MAFVLISLFFGERRFVSSAHSIILYYTFSRHFGWKKNKLRGTENIWKCLFAYEKYRDRKFAARKWELFTEKWVFLCTPINYDIFVCIGLLTELVFHVVFEHFHDCFSCNYFLCEYIKLYTEKRQMCHRSITKTFAKVQS